MSRLTERPWFGPKRFGWGWTPVTWQGWLVVVAFLAAVVLSGFYLAGAARVAVVVVLIVVLTLVAWLTGDAPGSRWRR
jgi:hypothetical protein